jgi:hypothetical protein
MSSKIKTKIELLLAKAEGTDNEHERDAYTAKAQRLMLEWGIEEADLEARGEVKPEAVVQQHRDYHGQFSMAMPGFANDIARGMGNLKVIKSGSKSDWRVYVIGHETDVANFWTMMDSLERQALHGLKVWWASTPDRAWLITATEKWKARRSFIMAFGSTCGARLRRLREEVQVEATPGAALVLVSKDERVAAKVEELYPSLRNGRSLQMGYSGAAAGREAGLRAHLGGKEVGTGTAGALR